MISQRLWYRKGDGVPSLFRTTGVEGQKTLAQRVMSLSQFACVSENDTYNLLRIRPHYLAKLRNRHNQM